MSVENTNNDAGQLVAFLNEQIRRNKRSTRLTWIVGGAILLVLAAYMSTIAVLLHEMLQPELTARMIAQQVEENLPGLMAEGEKYLEQEAVVLANSLSSELIGIMPVLREEAEAQIDATYEEWLPALREEARTSTRTFARTHGDYITELYEAHKDGDDFAALFIDQVVADLAAVLDAGLKEDSGGRGLVYVQEQTLDALKLINEQLAHLADTDPASMTRSERLQRRLIVTWAQAVEEITLGNERGNCVPLF